MSEIITPSQLVWKRLKQNKPAMIGLFIVLFTSFIAIFCYPFMPDGTTYANDGSIEIKKKPPGFSTQVVLITRQKIEQQSSTFSSWIHGTPNNYISRPIDSFELIDSSVVKLFISGSNKKIYEEVPLVQIITPMYEGTSTLLDSVYKKPFVKKGNTLRYLTPDLNIKEISIQEAYNIFKSEHLLHKTYLLGTDSAGRDLLSRLIYGTRISLGIGIMAVLISITVGIVLGAIAGYFGGYVDSVVSWFMTVIWAIPSIMLVIAISMALQSKEIWVAFLAVGLTMWVEVARVVRGQFMETKEKLFVEAAKALGYTNSQIIFSQMLPNMVGPIVVIATSNFATAILVEAGLSFLGLGVQPPVPSWGLMVHEGFKLMGGNGTSHLLLYPSVAISILVLAFNILGNGLRDAFDPNQTT